MENRIVWIGQRCFKGQTASGHQILMDGSVEHGGQNSGARPLELLLIGTGGCLFYDVIAILEKGNAQLHDGWMEIEQTQACSLPRVYEKIHFHLILVGTGIKANAVDRAIELAREKYCSASIMLSKSVQITQSYEIREKTGL